MGNGEGYSVIPSSTKRENLASNLLALELHLDAEDKKMIAALDCNDRLVSPEGLALPGINCLTLCTL